MKVDRGMVGWSMDWGGGETDLGNLGRIQITSPGLSSPIDMAALRKEEIRNSLYSEFAAATSKPELETVQDSWPSSSNAS